MDDNQGLYHINNHIGPQVKMTILVNNILIITLDREPN